MRILMLSWEYPPRIVGGIARHVEELSEALVAQGHEIHVVTAEHPNTPAYTQRKGVHIHRVPTETALTTDFVEWILHLNFEMAKQAIRLHQAQPFDLVHAHDWLVAQAGVLMKQAHGVPLLGTIHATESGRNGGIYSPIQKYINQQEWLLTYESYRVIVCSDYMRRQVRNQFGVPDDKLDTAYNGIDGSKFHFEFDRAAFRRQFAMDHEQLILFVGRMVVEKGAQILMEAVPEVLSRAPHAKFVIVGKGGFLPELKARARAIGTGSKVLFTGYVDDDTLVRLYRAADVDVIPSLYEPFGIVALEGLAAGVPVVVSDTGGLPEIIEHQHSGITTFAGDHSSLAWGILEMLRHPGHARWMAENGYRRVNEVFNWQAIAAQTQGVYERVLAMAGRAG